MDKVLIVDDDQESRELLCEVLESSGYATHAVANGREAREVLDRDVGYRIVIADLRMPQESGLELLQSIRRRNSPQEVILMSSFMTGPEKHAARELGAHTLLEKPFQFAELLQAVAELTTHNSISS